VQDPTDDRKRLLSALIEGPAMLVVDNIERPLQSDALCTAITEPTYTDRLLGQSRTVTVESNCLFAATGNNLTLAGDLSARAILCRLDPEVERPEQREFGVNLHEWVPAHRGELVAAALTIIRAYFVAGEPRPAAPNFARFEDWQRLCRFPLIWLGLVDPCETRRDIEAADPIRENLRGLLTAWHDHFDDQPTTVAQAIKAGENAMNRAGDTISSAGGALQEAMMAVAGTKGFVNSRTLGRFIGNHQRRIEGGLRFIRAGTSGNTARWQVTKEGLRGFEGLFPGPSRENGDGKQKDSISGDRLETNPPNPLNPSASMLREVEL
jgi:putative DNA primase/helicase